MEKMKVKSSLKICSNASEQTVFVRNLIDAVREHRCLYDKKDTAYFNRREKEKAWQIIGQQLGRSDVACHRRWKLLREKFAKELKKRDRMLKNGEHFQSDWTCFDNIMYIEEHIAPRKKCDRISSEVAKNSSTKRLIYENSSSADTTSEKRPYSSISGLDFLAQLSKARLQATQISESEIKLEKDESLKDDDRTATPAASDCDESSSQSITTCSETPATLLASTNAVDALLRELRTNKDTNLNFVKNLTNALKINNLDSPQLPLMFHQASNSRIDDNNSNQHSTVTAAAAAAAATAAVNIPDVVAMPLKHTPINDDVVRSTLLRVNGINNLVNQSSFKSNENISTEVSSSANLLTNDLKDEIFGKMVVTMLSDITDEECKDDAKFGIMQVLINAKRACRNKQLNRQ